MVKGGLFYGNPSHLQPVGHILPPTESSSARVKLHHIQNLPVDRSIKPWRGPEPGWMAYNHYPRGAPDGLPFLPSYKVDYLKGCSGGLKEITTPEGNNYPVSGDYHDCFKSN